MTILRFFTGDDNGLIKSVKFLIPDRKITAEDPVTATTTVIHEKKDGAKVQQMVTGDGPDDHRLLAIARANGEASLHSFTQRGDDMLPEQEWNETRFKKQDLFVGLSLSPRGVFTCTSRGFLRLQPLESDDQAVGEAPPTPARTTALPMRLRAWQLAPTQQHFAYGGDEVDLSVWDVERSFSESAAQSEETLATAGTKKRKKGQQKLDLLHGEVWRARNVQRDNLQLRVPVQITALTHLRFGPSQPNMDGNLILTGSSSGAVRLYDIRVQEKPMHDWSNICTKASVKQIQCGFSQDQVFISDAQNSLYTVDIRTGRSLYHYKAIKGAVVSVAPAPKDFMASVSLDRFARLHSTPPPPQQAGKNQSLKGATIHEEYMKGTPTVILWDGWSGVGKDEETKRRTWQEKKAIEAQEDDEIWNNMRMAGNVVKIDTEDSDDNEAISTPKAKRSKMK